MTVVVRTEAEADHAAVGAVVGEAFAPSTSEVALVEAIRASSQFVPELSLVAEVEGTIVGHAMTSWIWLDADSGGRIDVLGLAPVAVAVEAQRRGVGTALVEEGLRRAEATGVPMVVVLGHPGYYPRFGFERASVHRIRPAQAFRDESFMVRLFGPPVPGTVVYPPAFDG